MLISTFLWIGFVSAISFMEAHLKFQAPGITVPLGLGIGRLVFATLNKVEWVFALAISGGFLFRQAKMLSFFGLLFQVPLILLVIQTIWLLPALDARAELILSGMPVPASSLHIYYVAAEVIKVGCLSFFGIKQFQPSP